MYSTHDVRLPRDWIELHGSYPSPGEQWCGECYEYARSAALARADRRYAEQWYGKAVP